MIYRGLTFRPSIKVKGALDVWDELRKRWFYTTMVDKKKVMDYYLTEMPGRWKRTMRIITFDLNTLLLDGEIAFVF